MRKMKGLEQAGHRKAVGTSVRASRWPNCSATNPGLPSSSSIMGSVSGRAKRMNRKHIRTASLAKKRMLSQPDCNRPVTNGTCRGLEAEGRGRDWFSSRRSQISEGAGDFSLWKEWQFQFLQVRTYAFFSSQQARAMLARRIGKPQIPGQQLYRRTAACSAASVFSAQLSYVNSLRSFSQSPAGSAINCSCATPGSAPPSAINPPSRSSRS